MLNAKARPRKSLAKPIKAFFASSDENNGPSDVVNMDAMFSKEAGGILKINKS